MMYALAVIQFVVGLAGMALIPNLFRKLLAMNVMQVGVMAFFIALAWKRGAGTPIVGADAGVPEAAAHMNPLPHTLMLTAIVVSVATIGLALALLIRIRRSHQSLDEEELLPRLQERSPWPKS